MQHGNDSFGVFLFWKCGFDEPIDDLLVFVAVEQDSMSGVECSTGAPDLGITFSVRPPRADLEYRSITLPLAPFTSNSSVAVLADTTVARINRLATS